MENKSQLALALSKAQGEMKGAKKDSSNPFFKSTYADLSSVWEACRECLAKNEIAIIQKTGVQDGMFGIITKMIHSSGEFEEGFFPVAVPITAKAQDMGSAVTYARRYSLASMVGVSPEDDDGNSAQSTEGPKKWIKKEETIDVLRGIYAAINKAKNMQEVFKIVDDKKTIKFMDIGRESFKDEYEQIVLLTEKKRAEFEDTQAED